MIKIQGVIHMSDTITATIHGSNITKETAAFMATKEYQEQLALACNVETRGYDDNCPNEENKEDA